MGRARGLSGTWIRAVIDLIVNDNSSGVAVPRQFSIMIPMAYVIVLALTKSSLRSADNWSIHGVEMFVIAIFKTHSGLLRGEKAIAPLRFREVLIDDAQLLWSWTRDLVVRKHSFSPDLFAWRNHVRWCTEKVNDDNCLFLIAQSVSGQPLGQVRYDCDGNEAVVSVSVDHQQRGRGYGRQIIDESAELLFREHDVELIRAFIKIPNHASIRAFMGAGYSFSKSTIIAGYKASEFLLHRSTRHSIPPASR